MVTYSYDAWGRQYGIAGTMAATLGKLNPFRYRGYVYDEETSLYYLRSRYYNPEWGRFISADVIMGEVGALDSHNLFAYCGNNPVHRSDKDGFDSQMAIEFYRECSIADGPGWIGDAIGVLGWAVISLYTLATSWSTPQTRVKSNTSTLTTTAPSATASTSPKPSITPAPQTTPAPKLTPNPDEKYWLAVAFGGSSPIKMGQPMDAIDVSLLLHVANWVGVYNEALSNASIAGVPVAYGVYTPLQADAATIASFFGAATRCDNAKGSKYPHYHGLMSDYETLHFWYSP